MKKSKRYVRICAALLCAVLCLSVNVAPAMAAKVTQADIDALKGNAASLDKKQKEIQSKRSPLLTKLKDKMNRKISQSGLDATIRYDLHTRLSAMHDHIKVCHGDFNPSNVIVDKDGRLYVIDWSHATQGNGSADAARTYLMFRLNGRDDWAELYLKMFCDMNDVAKQYVSQWLPIVAASQLSKENPQEREFLLNWVNVFDYE